MRAEMVFRLVQRQGLSQSDAAKRLGITRAAVSQYLSRKRGAGEVQISNELDNIIDRWALAVVTGESDINLCDVCQCALKKF
jgi:predicted transcriptional regulator